MDYLDKLLEPFNRNSNDREPLRRLISHSTSSRFLRSLGYKFITFQTGVATTDVQNSDHYVVGRVGLNEFETALLLLTPLGRLSHWFQVDRFELHRQRQLNILDYLEAMPAEDSPVFVFAHILACHPPFVFDQEGGRVTDDVEKVSIEGIPFPLYADDKAYRRSYIRQMVYFTSRVRRILENMMQRSNRACIIVLQSDHGPGSRSDMLTGDNPHLRETMSILNAYYFPRRAYDRLYSKITPVNTFRVILDQYFGTSLGFLPDASYFTTWQQPYRFVPVSGKLDHLEAQRITSNN